MKNTLIALCLIVPTLAMAQVAPAPAPAPATQNQTTNASVATTNPTPGIRQFNGTGPHGKMGMGQKATPRKSTCANVAGSCPNQAVKAATPAK